MPPHNPIVTAVFALVNRGGAGAFVTTSLYVDGRFATAHDFQVPAGATIQGRISYPLQDCSHHAYSLETRYIVDSGG